jgi:hypothetical protein
MVMTVDAEEEAVRGVSLVVPSAGQLARDPRVFDLRDDEPIAMIVAANQGSAPAARDCRRLSLNLWRAAADLL